MDQKDFQKRSGSPDSFSGQLEKILDEQGEVNARKGYIMGKYLRGAKGTN